MLLPATPGWVSLPVVVGGPRHSSLGSACGGGVWCVLCGGGVLVGLWLVCGVVGPSPLLAEVPLCYSPPLLAWFRCRWSWAVPATPGWGPLAAVVCGVRCVVCGAGVLLGLWLVCGVVGVSPLLAVVSVCYSPPLLAGFRCRWWWAVPATPGWGPLAAVVCCVWCVVCGVLVGSLATPGGGSCVLLPAIPGWVSLPLVVGGPRHSWLGSAGGGGVWCVVCGVWRWCVVGVVVGVWCGWSLATPGGGPCVLLPATPGWVSLPLVVGGPRHSWLGSAGGGGVWCVVCGGGVLVGLWLGTHSSIRTAAGVLVCSCACFAWPGRAGRPPGRVVVRLTFSFGRFVFLLCSAPSGLGLPLSLSLLLPFLVGWGLWCVGWLLPGTCSCAVVRCVLCALSGFVAPGGRRCLAPARVPWLWPAACLSGVPRGPAWCPAPRPVRSLSVLRSAFPTPWCLSAPRELAPPALLGGCAGHAEAGREPGSLCLPLAPAEAGALGSLRVVPVRRPAMGLSLAGPSGVGLGLRALRWLACVDPVTDASGFPYRPSFDGGLGRCTGAVSCGRRHRPLRVGGRHARVPCVFACACSSWPGRAGRPPGRVLVRLTFSFGRFVFLLCLAPSGLGLPLSLSLLLPFLVGCFSRPPAAWLSVRSRLACVSRLAVGCSLVVAPPPPSPFVSRGFWSLLLCALVFFFFFLRLFSLCAHVALAFSGFRPRVPWASALALFALLAFRFSALRALVLLSCFPPGCWLLLPGCCPPPPPFVSRGFRVCRSVLCAVLCCASLGAVPRRAAARSVARCCAVVCCVALVCCRCLLRRALWRCPSPWGPVLCGAAFCGVPPRCVLCAVCVLS